MHTAAIYDGFRRDVKHKRALILSRDAYLGAQRNGTMFWSSDIYPDVGHAEAADSHRPRLHRFRHGVLDATTLAAGNICRRCIIPAHPPLLDPSDARDNVGGYDDYPELYTRWFEYGAFLPIFRTHGSRKYNEVWSYGKQAEPILEKYLRLRYQLMPYIYSLGYTTYQTGAPSMRALFMDFPNDPKVADLGDEYMFGPAFLVAPVTEQGATSRDGLSAGRRRLVQLLDQRAASTAARRSTLPRPSIRCRLFVRAGSILPLGEAIENTNQVQKIAKVRVYPGSECDFTLYQDDGKTYAYEKGDSSITHLALG